MRLSSQNFESSQNFASNSLPPVTMTGYSSSPAGYTVYLSDGRIVEQSEGRITYLAKDHVVIGTNVYRLNNPLTDLHVPNSQQHTSMSRQLR